jgi:hypothetical protein
MLSLPEKFRLFERGGVGRRCARNGRAIGGPRGAGFFLEPNDHDVLEAQQGKGAAGKAAREGGPAQAA